MGVVGEFGSASVRIHGRSGDFELFGEVGDGVVPGSVHAAKFFLLLDGQLGLSALGPSVVSSERTTIWAES
jgi:hypothetical protein